MCMGQGSGARLRASQLSLATKYLCGVAIGEFSNLSVPLFIHLQNEGNWYLHLKAAVRLK